MSDTKFTAGNWVGFSDGEWFDSYPWSVDNEEYGSYSYVAVGGYNGVICLVVTTSRNDTEMDHNAHLIAAAPEMYEVLSLLLSNSTFNVEHPAFAEEIELLLAKARGEK